MPDTNSIPSFGIMIRKALGDALSPDAGDNFLAMCSDDIVFQFPFAPVGTVTEVRGIENLTKYLSTVGGLIAFDSLSDPIVHPSQDGETFTVEVTCKGRGKITTERYDQTYVSLIRVRNRKIVQYRDYWNPLILLDAVGGVEPLKSTLAEFING